MRIKQTVIAIVQILSLIILLPNGEGKGVKGVKLSTGIKTVAFGSCAHQDKPQPVLEMVVAFQPDIFIYLGDNVYNDSYTLRGLRRSYRKLAVKPEFRILKSSTEILATWDDHDYGWNDSGKDYPYRHASKSAFLNFFGIPDSSLLKHRGIYYSKMYRMEKNVLQIIMLDTRTFRDSLLAYNGNRENDSRFNYKMDYSPHVKPGPSILGKSQWIWLEKQLRRKADIRIIASSIQFAATHNGYEAWANFPHEQKRMTDTIKRTGAEGVVFISGDVHYAEISRLKAEGVYPLYDITSSGITSTWDFATPNDNRIDGPVMENNFGLLTVNRNEEGFYISVQIYDVKGDLRIERIIKIENLKLR